MNRGMPFRRTAVLAVCLLIGAPSVLPAQAGDLPPAAEVVARYVTAVGGRQALAAKQSIRTTGIFEMGGAGIRGEIEVLQLRPNRIQTRVVIPAIGEIRSGFDGTVGWSNDPLTGPRLLSGSELQQLRDQADFTASLRLPGSFASMETIERAEVAGQPCYRVQLVWKSGRESVDCFSVETGLLVASSSKQESPMGTIEVTSTMSDYKEFGGIRFATRMVQEMLGQQQIFTVSNVEFDAVDESAFELPQAVRTLVERGN
jgi:hypothetical protein